MAWKEFWDGVGEFGNALVELERGQKRADALVSKTRYDRRITLKQYSQSFNDIEWRSLISHLEKYAKDPTNKYCDIAGELAEYADELRRH
ncbi:hypothetical protein [uncultured Nostoc sp.]|uniref:hypothetical protein n=1 Tax=uncultured Nostoc sp. TaxID=340711 RepID=UPI0035CB27FE